MLPVIITVLHGTPSTLVKIPACMAATSEMPSVPGHIWHAIMQDADRDQQDDLNQDADRAGPFDRQTRRSQAATTIPPAKARIGGTKWNAFAQFPAIP